MFLQHRSLLPRIFAKPTPICKSTKKPLTVGIAVRCKASREGLATPTLIPATKIGRTKPPIFTVRWARKRGLSRLFVVPWYVSSRLVLSWHTRRYKAFTCDICVLCACGKTMAEPAHNRFALLLELLCDITPGIVRRRSAHSRRKRIFLLSLLGRTGA